MRVRMLLLTTLFLIAVSISGGCYVNEGDETTVVPPTEPPTPIVCVAGFSWASVPGTLSVAFSNQSTPAECAENQWDFGDGTGTSRERDPVHSYLSAGDYIARLTVCPTEDFSAPECSSASRAVVVSEIVTNRSLPCPSGPRCKPGAPATPPDGEGD